MVDLLSLLAMQHAGVFDDLLVMEIRERIEAREARRREP